MNILHAGIAHIIVLDIVILSGLLLCSQRNTRQMTRIHEQISHSLKIKM